MAYSKTICLFQVQESPWQNKGWVLKRGQTVVSLTSYALLSQSVGSVRSVLWWSRSDCQPEDWKLVSQVGRIPNLKCAWTNQLINNRTGILKSLILKTQNSFHWISVHLWLYFWALVRNLLLSLWRIQLCFHRNLPVALTSGKQVGSWASGSWPHLPSSSIHA